MKGRQWLERVLSSFAIFNSEVETDSILRFLFKKDSVAIYRIQKSGAMR